MVLASGGGLYAAGQWREGTPWPETKVLVGLSSYKATSAIVEAPPS